MELPSKTNSFSIGAVRKRRHYLGVEGGIGLLKDLFSKIDGEGE